MISMSTDRPILLQELSQGDRSSVGSIIGCVRRLQQSPLPEASPSKAVECLDKVIAAYEESVFAVKSSEKEQQCDRKCVATIASWKWFPTLPYSLRARVRCLQARMNHHKEWRWARMIAAWGQSFFRGVWHFLDGSYSFTTSQQAQEMLLELESLQDRLSYGCSEEIVRQCIAKGNELKNMLKIFAPTAERVVTAVVSYMSLMLPDKTENRPYLVRDLLTSLRHIGVLPLCKDRDKGQGAQELQRKVESLFDSWGLRKENVPVVPQDSPSIVTDIRRTLHRLQYEEEPIVTAFLDLAEKLVSARPVQNK